MSDKSHQAAMQSLMDLKLTEKGQQLMRIIRADSFELISNSDLDNVRDLVKRYKTLKNQNISNTRPAKANKSTKVIN